MQLFKYLFKLNTPYNNQQPYYELSALPYSDQIKTFIFSGKEERLPNIEPTYIYLELSNKMDDKNRYPNLQRLLNLIALESIQVSAIEEISIVQSDDFQSIYQRYKGEKFYEPVHKSGIKPDFILRVKKLVELLLKLSLKDFEKFDNSLNTFIWALEIRQNINPHLKFTLYMTLLLSSIEQLCKESKNCPNHQPCPECSRERFHHKKDEGQMFALEQLVRNLLTGSGVDDGVIRVKKLYKKLRSSFLHTGKLYGDEKKGGFLSDISRDKELLEDEMNIIVMNQMLLEQFCQRGGNP